MAWTALYQPAKKPNKCYKACIHYCNAEPRQHKRDVGWKTERGELNIRLEGKYIEQGHMLSSGWN